MKKKMLLTLLVVTIIFLLNTMWLIHLMHSDRSELHASPLYPTYVAFRTLFLQPRTIIVLGLSLSAWLLLVYRNTQKKPLTDGQKILLVTVLLGLTYGFALLASFKL